jgi:hypothetical protein
MNANVFVLVSVSHFYFFKILIEPINKKNEKKYTKLKCRHTYKELSLFLLKKNESFTSPFIFIQIINYYY